LAREAAEIERPPSQLSRTLTATPHREIPKNLTFILEDASK
jgi:hypothetical protein